jgi:hypothetical protein
MIPLNMMEGLGCRTVGKQSENEELNNQSSEREKLKEALTWEGFRHVVSRQHMVPALQPVYGPQCPDASQLQGIPLLCFLSISFW